MSLESDIIRLENMAREAVKLKDFERARRIAKALDAAQAELEASGKKTERQKLPPVDSSIKSFGLGAQREGGRYLAGARELSDLAVRVASGRLGEDTGFRDDLILSERAKEQDFADRTANNPVAGFAGRMVPPMVLSAGRTAPGAFMRGGAAGLLAFNEDPSLRAMQGIMGGAANVAGRGILGRVGLNKTAQRANQQGFRLLPEQRGPTLTRALGLENTLSFENAAARVGRANAKTITKESLRTIGLNTSRFNDETLGMVEGQIGKRFDDALAGKEKMFIAGQTKTRIQVHLDNMKDEFITNNKAINAVKKMQEKLAGRDIMDISEYQSLRSQLTDELYSTATSGKGKKIRKAIGGMIEILDDTANSQLPPAKAKALMDARKQWRQFSMFKTPDIYDPQSGLINPRKLTRLLQRKDEAGFTLNRDQGKLAELLRLDRQTPFSTSSQRQLDQLRDTRILTGGLGARVGRGLLSPVESLLIGAARSPTRVIEGAPLAATIPLLRPPVQGRGDDSDELVIRR